MTHKCMGPLFFIMLTGLLVAAIPNSTSAQTPASSNRVLLVSCDGLRPDAIPLANTPVLKRLIDTGSYQSRALAELPPVTLPNHASIVTGLSVAQHGILFNTFAPGRIDATTIFDVAESAGLGVGFFANKGKLAFLCEESAVDVWRITGDVDTLANEVVAAIETHDLQLIFVHFGEPDGAGHQHGWMSEAYLEQVARVDAALGRILDALEAGNFLDQTLVIVTSDHGGHDHTHWLNIAEDRFVPYILNGPAIAPGRTLCDQIHAMDAAATALKWLDLPLESARDGTPIDEAAVAFTQPGTRF
ncbi:MAG: alkaline phosphatase family protein [Phycisphaerae bacterium]